MLFWVHKSACWYSKYLKMSWWLWLVVEINKDGIHMFFFWWIKGHVYNNISLHCCCPQVFCRPSWVSSCRGSFLLKSTITVTISMVREQSVLNRTYSMMLMYFFLKHPNQTPSLYLRTTFVSNSNTSVLEGLL